MNSSIWPIDETITGSTIPGQSGPERNSNKGVHHTSQSTRNGVSSLNGLVSYPGHSFGGGEGILPSAEMQLAYSTAPVD